MMTRTAEAGLAGKGGKENLPEQTNSSLGGVPGRPPFLHVRAAQKGTLPYDARICSVMEPREWR